MSKSNLNNPVGGGSAPPYNPQYNYSTDMRAPPPTYEQSQMQPQGNWHVQAGAPAMATPANQYYGMMHHQQLPVGYGLAGPSTSAGATAAQVLHVDARAEVRTTASGSVMIPPPPPGCLPTPAQLAAMQCRPVVVQQKKRSFF